MHRSVTGLTLVVLFAHHYALGSQRRDFEAIFVLDHHQSFTIETSDDSTALSVEESYSITYFNCHVIFYLSAQIYKKYSFSQNYFGKNNYFAYLCRLIIILFYPYMAKIDPRNIEIKDYDYPLPDDRIARYPLAQRDQSKLLVWHPAASAEEEGVIEEHHFCDLPSQIPAGSMIVFNNTKVIQARLHFRKPTGGIVEVFCLEPEAPKDYQLSFASESECTWTCLVGNSKKWKEGALSLSVKMPDGREVTLHCERAGELGPSQKIRFYWGGGYSFAQLLDAMGELPIPPYLNRETEESDKKTYQTVYSKIQGSVAAPTAGLHYTPEVLDKLQQKGCSLQYLTLHVGAGTFKPVKSETIEGHDMHTEFISVPRSVIESILAFKRGQKEVITPLPRREGLGEGLLLATGTTSVRTLESLYYIGVKLSQVADFMQVHSEDLIVHQWEPYDLTYCLSLENALQRILDYLDAIGQEQLVTATQILIAPGFQYRVIDAIVTNFHMPQSTLLLLVSALTDGDSLQGENWHRIYRYALDHQFRFLSYGDSSLLFRKDKK